MKLESVSVRNFRAIRSLDLPLHERLTVLVGENAAGKTCLLDAIARGLEPLTDRAAGVRRMGGPRVEEPVVEPVGPPLRHSTRADIRRVNGVWSPVAGVEIKTTRGDRWRHRILRDEAKATHAKADEEFPPLSVSSVLAGIDDTLAARAEGEASSPLPLVVYYGTERSVLKDQAPLRQPPWDGAPWRDAFRGALRAPAHFAQMFSWFEAVEAEELRRRRDESPTWVHPQLAAVRRAVEAVIPGAHDLRVSGGRRLQVTVDETDGHREELNLSELSGGYRTLLALVADLARRMAQANPDQGTESEVVVLIDEVDLHLHPRWQQTVLGDVLRAFPNAQFIVSTHSEQVIASVTPASVVRLDRSHDGVVVSRPSSTFGATPDRIASDVLGVPHLRPPEVEDALTRYWAFIRTDEAASAEGTELRSRLDDWFRGQDPELIRADAEIQRRQLLARLRLGDR